MWIRFPLVSWMLDKIWVGKVNGAVIMIVAPDRMRIESTRCRRRIELDALSPIHHAQQILIRVVVRT